MKNLTYSTKNNILKTSIKTTLFGAVLLAFIVSTIPVSAFAFTSPTLSISNLNNGTAQMIVSGDSSAQIYLYYYNTSAGVSGTAGVSAPISLGTIGNTGENGYFSEALSPYNNGSPYAYTGATYNAALAAIPYGAPVYVVVDGLQSSTVYWPLSYGSLTPIQPVGATGAIYFNPNSINLTVGQSQNVQIYQSLYENSVYNYSGSYYVSSNSNPSAVSASINSTSAVANGVVNGSTLYVTGETSGSATITVCVSGASYPTYSPYTYSNQASSQCTSLYVTVSYPVGYNYPGYPVVTNSYPTTYTYPAGYNYPVIAPVPVNPYIPATVYNVTPIYYPSTYQSNYYPTYYPQ